MTDDQALSALVRIVSQRDPGTDPVPSNQQLAARIAELRKDGGLVLRVVKAQADAAIVLVENGDDGPFLMVVSADHLPITKH
ncbi:hypothetical protein ACOQNP_11235 [Ectopseudomonas khazarica]|uniref:hypothetical protein n=1 Tax=Ectopseudomonas khazarica TaxID=2502979 RepID=UPI003B958BE5